MDEKIDFVIIWVDGGDIEWQKERNKYAGKDLENLADYRFRDWDNLKYWFRGVEKYAPWVNNVFFITNGQKPEWLNLNCPKLRWVKHDDYIPKEWLPTFSANPIELNLHRIKELSEKFVFFNDDTFLTNKVRPEDFFLYSKPRRLAGLDIIVNQDEIFSSILLNDINLINRHFKMDEVLKKNKKKWFYIGYGFNKILKTLFLKNYSCFPGLLVDHTPVAMRKSTYDKLWKEENSILSNSSKNRFRNREDVNQYVFKWWDICSGDFEPKRLKYDKYFAIGINNAEIIDCIKGNKYKTICLNDTSNDIEFEKAKHEINDAFESILPKKSIFEL